MTESNRKWLNLWNIILVVIGAVTLIGLIKKALDKIDLENIDCDEYDQNLESVNNKKIEINLYKDSDNNVVVDKVVVDDVIFSENSLKEPEVIFDETQDQVIE
ncbi:MAG: hypothetical protein J6C55_02715 [Oscillospiraceae bacterium]|nr:hypothetical protein [Oscillospiraceae bacterium]